MATYKTFGEISRRVTADTATKDEDFITPKELRYFINDEVDRCEALIHTLGLEDDYFLAQRDLEVKANQSEVEFPSDIYAYKIKNIVYESGGADYYEIKRLRGKDRFLEITNLERYGTAPYDYFYYILNSRPKPDPANPNRIESPNAKIMLIPRPTRDSSDAERFKCYYIRNAQRMIDENTICDIPEFFTYIEKRVKYRIYAKEGLPLMQDAKQEAEMASVMLRDTLSTMVPDGNNTLEKDFSHYFSMDAAGEGIGEM